MEAVIQSFRLGSFLKGGNSSFITLNPKITNVNMVKDFRPISLIGSLDKIIAKILANRLVVVLGDIVNEVQSNFVADRQIFDGPFILNELIHCCHWSDSNIITIVHVLDCFYRVSDLRINLNKSKLLGISVDDDKVDQASAKIGCVTIRTPFSYLGSKVVGHMHHIQSWNKIVNSMVARLVIKEIHGEDGKIGKNTKSAYPFIWLDIVYELELMKKQGIDLIGCIYKKIGNGANTLFWEDVWRGEVSFKYLYPRVYVLELRKSVDVASKLSHLNLSYSFRRDPRGGAEQAQYLEMLDKVEGTSLVNLRDRWVWSLERSGEFTIASVRRLDCLPTRLNISRRERFFVRFPAGGKSLSRRTIHPTAISRERRMAASILRLHFHDCFVSSKKRHNHKSSLVSSEYWSPISKLHLNSLISTFNDNGLSPRDMVALSGAHTIGQAQCFLFRDRIYANGSDIDAGFASTRRRRCPINEGNENLAALDLVTPNSFDNNYFKNLIQKKGLLESDQVLFSGGSTDSIVREYSNNPSKFKSDFAAAMVKMSEFKTTTGQEGVIRRICSALP
ncbi:lignin-forming anionic peroxidase [Tanacetum coccineum]